MINKIAILFFFCLLSTSIFGQSNDVNDSRSERGLPNFMRSSATWADSVLSSLSLEEKIAQSFMVALNTQHVEQRVAEFDSLINKVGVGGVILYQDDTSSVKTITTQLNSIAKLPLLIGYDLDRSRGNQKSFHRSHPYALTFGAANDEESTEIITAALGADLKQQGINLIFSPNVNVNTDPNNVRLGFQSFGESPLTVANHSRAVIKGLQESDLLTCMKHFPGQGDMELISGTSLPTISKSKTAFDRADWVPFRMGRLTGASAVMMSHASVPALDSSNTPASLSKLIIEDLLKKELKFSGLVISDDLNVQSLINRYGAAGLAAEAYLAGNDMLVYPQELEKVLLLIAQAVEDGKINIETIDAKCLKILRAKQFAASSNAVIHEVDKEELEAAEMAVYEKSIVVVKNDSVIPVYDATERNLIISLGQPVAQFEKRFSDYAKTDVLNANSGIDAIMKYALQWKEYDNIFVNISASDMSASNDYHYPAGWRALLDALPPEANVYVTLFGNPYVANDETVFSNVDAVLLAYQQSDLGQDRAAQLLFGGYQSTTPLSITLNAIYQEGFFAETPAASRLKYTVPMELGVRKADFDAIDSIAINGIREKAYPSCQVVVAKDGKVVYRKSFGFFTYDSLQEANDETIYDLASITKIVSSTSSLMYLQDRAQFSLNTYLGDYLSDLTSGTAYDRILLRDMMAHQARLSPWIPFYTATLDGGVPKTSIYSRIPKEGMSRLVADDLFILDSYEDTMYQRILNTGLRRDKKYKYSDLGYYFAKRIIESETNTSLDNFVDEAFYKPMGLTTMGYHPLNRFDKSQIAPTEQDQYFRYQLVQGHVHDMGAAMMNGVGGHAGVFASATDLAGFMQMLLNNGVYGRRRYLSEAVIKEYTSCQFCPTNRRGAGFDKPVRNLNGGPTCNLVSLSSYGHSGFTGTQTWSDPKNGVNYVFLSNRVYPSGENWKIVKMNIRTDIQRVIYELFPITDG
jgi:beta-glucosidase-like glycosyl hydrolase/CubicO group peptidase (beta-lactamase class C family)